MLYCPSFKFSLPSWPVHKGQEGLIYLLTDYYLLGAFHVPAILRIYPSLFSEQSYEGHTIS